MESGCCSSSLPCQLHGPAALWHSYPERDKRKEHEVRPPRKHPKDPIPLSSPTLFWKNGDYLPVTVFQEARGAGTGQSVQAPKHVITKWEAAGASTTCTRSGASSASSDSASPLRQEERARGRERRRALERAEGFESAAQLAHNVLHHACTAHTYMNINTFFRATMSCGELAGESQTEAQPWSEQSSQLLPYVLPRVASLLI